MSTISTVPLTGTAPSNSTSTSSSSSSTAAALPTQTLTQQDFLKIMIAEFTTQDPLASDGSGGSGGSSSSDYVNQLMNMTNMTTMQTMSGQIGTSSVQQALLLAQSLPGDTVTLANTNGTVQGVVQGTSINGTDVSLLVNGQQYDVSELTGINQTVQSASIAGGAAVNPAVTPPVTPATAPAATTTTPSTITTTPTSTP